MISFLQRLPIYLEFIVNGPFILLYALKSTKNLPRFLDGDLCESILHHGVWIIPFVLLSAVVLNYFNSDGVEDYLRKHAFSLVVFVPLVIAWGDLEFSFLLSSAHLLSSFLSLTDSSNTQYMVKVPERKSRHWGSDQRDDGELQDESLVEVSTSEGMLLRDLFDRFKLRPTQAVVLSFVAVILIGAFLLVLPVSSVEGKNISFVDALFMSTSATCVTGLATVSLHDDFSLFGQLVILLLMQVGGLGIMTLSASMTIFLGRSFEMRERVAMQDVLDVANFQELFETIISIVKYTFFIELWGGIFLTVGFTMDGMEFGRAIYYGFFHSVSAFCNAGLALFNDSFESYATNPLIHGTIAGLITFGGLGFVVLKELNEIITRRKTWARVSVHSKVVILMSTLLTLSGTLFIFFSEYLHALDGLNLWQKVQVALFQSVTLRTAGFNTIPLPNLHNYTIYVMIMYMFVGASPGGTGGGIKTTTLAILLNSIKSTFTGMGEVVLFKRKISPQVVVKVIGVTFVSLVIVNFFTLILMNIESKQTLLTLAFEVTSAFGTVGLSLGITPYLSVAGKLIISLVMLIGRVGPMTMMLFFSAQTESTGKLGYPEGRIMIG